MSSNTERRCSSFGHPRTNERGGGGGGMRSAKLHFLLLVVVYCACLAPSLQNGVVGKDNVELSPREQVKEMFLHAYSSYMRNAFPMDELLPLNCSGINSYGNYSTTLIDALDALLVFGEHQEFTNGVRWLAHNLNFHQDVNVSVFETNIRVVGGLLSAHLLLSEPQFQSLLPNDVTPNTLLDLAVDLADRLLPAFQTPTGIPYGTVNLMHGVPSGETPVTAVASASTYALEFGILSALTGNPIYEQTARKAVRAVWERRSSIGLLGNHIDVTGKWVFGDASIGAAVDSFYEYLLKAAIYFSDQEYFAIFQEAYKSVLKYLRHGPWYIMSNMSNGSPNWFVFDALQAFWPSLQVMVGDIHLASDTAHAMYGIWRHFGCTPELMDLKEGRLLDHHRSYPLRPELVESTYYLYLATNDTVWRRNAQDVIFSLQTLARVECGFAGILDVFTLELEDQMNSFILSETLKYLYLIFDDTNWVHYDSNRQAITQRYMFNTEGHIFPFRVDFLRPESLGTIPELAAPLPPFLWRISGGGVVHGR
ncbi:ER degradation-enhancing alpha-mannosidase-like protein 2 [Balamuthia mandrillaris]